MDIQIPNVEWQPLAGTLPPIPIKAFRGTSTLDKFSLQDSFSTKEKNLTSRNFPSLTVRPGFTRIGDPFMGTPKGMGLWKDEQLNVISGGKWYKYVDGWVEVATGLDQINDWSFCNFKGNLPDVQLIAANGFDLMKRYDGTSLVNVGEAPEGANFVDQHDNRLYCAVKNILHYSALSKPQDWTTAREAGNIVIENNEIVGMKAGSGHILVFTKNFMRELWGTNPSNYVLRPVAEDIGVLNNRCIVNVNGVTYFADVNGIYRYMGGTRPNRDFSLGVQEYINKINPNKRDQCAMGTDGKRVYFSFPSGASATNNVTLEYNPDFEGIWNVWSGMYPMQYVKIETDMYWIDSTNRVMKLGGSADDGIPIDWEWESRPFGGGSFAQQYRWHRLWYVADVPVGSTLKVYLSRYAEGDNWTLVNSVASTSLKSAKVMIPVSAVANANWIRVKFAGTGPVSIHEIDRQTREIPLG